jgi:hypothetical protein
MKIRLTEQPMNKAVERLTVFFVGVFALCCVAVAAYQLIWVMPAKTCEDHGAWWDPETRVCATPLYIPALTHRKPGSPKLTPQAREAR